MEFHQPEMQEGGHHVGINERAFTNPDMFMCDSNIPPLLSCSSCCRSYEKWNINLMFLISNFHHALNVVFFLLGDSPASEFYIPTFRNTLFHLNRRCKWEA
jgi:hypothetical protein